MTGSPVGQLEMGLSSRHGFRMSNRHPLLAWSWDWTLLQVQVGTGLRSKPLEISSSGRSFFLGSRPSGVPALSGFARFSL